MTEDEVAQARALRAALGKFESAVGEVIVGQREVIFEVLVGLLAGGHCILTGVPGLAKTLLVSTLARALELSFARIQFTPDLMPSDITGTEILEEDSDRRRYFRFLPGPVFAQVILADEINRTPPKTQAALLQAMQEGQVTVGGTTHELPRPFYVLATRNPIEQEGTYPLPEAQLDRFMLNSLVPYPSAEEEEEIVATTTAAPLPEPEPVMAAQEVLAYQELVRRVPLPADVLARATALVRRSRPGADAPPYVAQWVKWGAGPRAAQHLILAAKAAALLSGDFAVTLDEIERLVKPVLRHRLVLNFVAEAEGVTPDDILERLLADTLT
ncbi:MAG: AAA family ATPase [Candidatus Coatesbacteria bacterium]|nr:MAG: AAA family ATPase [Candidatus Coatesbacteria bacterium]